MSCQKNNEKILILISNNGTHGRFRKLVKSMKNAGFDPHVILAFSKNKNHLQFNNKKNQTDPDFFSSTRIYYSYKHFFFPFFAFFFLIYFRLKGYKKIHICNEQMLFFVPYVKLIFTHVALDIFDSFYLKHSFLNYLIPQFLLHKLVNFIIVTDSTRLSLLPISSQKKSIVVPNYPRKDEIIDATFLPRKIFSKDKITIGYFGTMYKERGIELMNNLLDKDEVNVICGGWCYDEYSKKFITKNKVSYVGVLHQREIFKILRMKIDYLICIYPYNNLNNIHASPNKIWEASILGVPLIINSEIKVSQIVKNENLGIVINYNASNDEILKQIKNAIINSDNNPKHFWEDSINPTLNFYKSIK